MQQSAGGNNYQHISSTVSSFLGKTAESQGYKQYFGFFHLQRVLGSPLYPV
jgi:hypothetical protein